MLKRKPPYAYVCVRIFKREFTEPERERERETHTYATPLWELALWITRAGQEYYGGRVFIGTQKDDVYVYEWMEKREGERKRTESRTMKRE